MASNSINQGAAGGVIIQPTWGTIEGGGSSGKEDNFDAILNELRTYLDAKADKKDVYTKYETNELLDGKSDKSNVYTKNETDGLLAGKSDTGHTHNYAGSSSVGGAANSLANFTVNKNSGQDANNVIYAAHTYYTSNGPATSLGASTNDGALYSQAYSDIWVAQVAQDYRNGNLFTRGKNNGTWQAWKAVSYNGHTHAYLPTAGGTMTGNATFNAGKNIQKAGESTSWINGRNTALVRVTSYTGYSSIISQKTTAGSWELGTYTDNKFYITYAKDAYLSANNNTISQYCFPPMSDGRSVDVSTAVTSISRSGTTFTATRANGTTFTFTQQDSDTKYSAGTGLGLSGTSFYLPIPRVAESCNALPGGASVRFREYTAGANYGLPSNHWYQILEIRSQDTNYGTQLALGMTVDAAYYRKYSGAAWGGWKSLINTWRGIQDNLSSQATDQSLSAKQGYILNSKMAYSSGSGTMNATYVSNGSCNWYKQRCGDHYITLVAYDFNVNGTQTSHNTSVFFTGLPTPIVDVVWPARGSCTDITGMGILLFSGGRMLPWYCGNVSGHWYGTVTYIS